MTVPALPAMRRGLGDQHERESVPRRGRAEGARTTQHERDSVPRRGRAEGARTTQHERDSVPRRGRAEGARKHMSDFLQLVVAGLSSGAIYALVAMGFVVVFSVSGVINLAQGEFAAIGGLVALGGTDAGLPLPVAMLVGLLV